MNEPVVPCVLRVDARERALIERMCASARIQRIPTDTDKGSSSSSSLSASSAEVDREKEKGSAAEAERLERMEVKGLDLADVQFVDTGPVEHVRIYVERKTLADFCASVKDGRYTEQKYRLLSNAASHSAKIVYLVEGYSGFAGLEDAAERHGLQKTALQSCVYNLMFESGIFVLFTTGLQDSADAILRLWQRHLRRVAPVAPVAQQNRTEELPTDAAQQLQQLHVAHAKKNRNITRQTCYLMQLSQIPGVSFKTACTIGTKWKTMADLYADLGAGDDAYRIKQVSSLNLIGKKNARQIVDHLFPTPEEGPSFPERDTRGKEPCPADSTYTQ